MERSVWVMVIHAVVVAFAALTGFAYLTLLERKLLARMQHRVGPNKAGAKGSYSIYRIAEAG